MAALQPISKRRFGKIRALHTKKERLTSGLSLLEGERLVAEAMRDRIAIEVAVGTEEFWSRRSDLLHSLAASGIATAIATAKQMAILSLTEHSSGILAVVGCPSWSANDQWERLADKQYLGMLTLGIQDPGNLGTMIRTLAAADGSCLWMSPGNAESASPKVLRASAGAVFRLPIVNNIAPLELLERAAAVGVQTLAAVANKGRSYATIDLCQPTILVMGAEGGGIPDQIIAQCTQTVHIPMPGETESLNVAAAAAIITYEAVRQRRLVQARTRRS